jgi:hypothetical protein
VGLTGSWIANETLVAAGSLTQGDLVTKGGKIAGLGGSINRFAGARAISTSALAGNGLLDDGATLWFGAIVGFDTGGNVTNSRLALALANSQFNSGNYKYWINNEGAQLGAGVGLVLGNVIGVNGRVVATRFRDLAAGDGLNGNVLGTWTGAGSAYGAGTQGLVVGKITWGATPGDLDRIELYQPGSNLALPATPISVLSTQVNQAAFDTLTMARGDKIVCDEIRFGATYQSILAGTVAMTADLAAPAPNPMTFHSPPALAGAGSISMVAATAFDPAGVEYYFTCTSGSASGGNDSGWQDSPAYTDTGLAPGVSYTYTVKARDKSPAGNQTAASAPESVPDQVAIPDLTGLSEADAAFILTASNLYLGTVTTAASPTTPAGHVIRQSPSGASTAASFSTVDLVLAFVGNGSPYERWSGGAPAEEDSNHDGVPNAIAWALGAATPQADATGLLPAFDPGGDPDYVTFAFERGDSAREDPGTILAVEYGNDLSGWTAAVHDGDNVIITETPGGPTDSVEVKLRRSTLGAGGRIFIRLRVSVATP